MTEEKKSGYLEVTMEELQEMLLQGKISTEQFVSILRENLGDEEVNKLLKESVEASYENGLLIKPVPKSLMSMIKPSLDNYLSVKPKDKA